jgi:hypothetical protein
MLLAKKAQTEAKNAEEEAEKKQIIQQQIDEEEKRLEKTDKSYKFNKTVDNALNLVFFADQFGWINCDRFLQNDAPLVDVSVQAPMCENAQVSMVFDRDKCIVSAVKQGDRYVFNGVPANTNVRLITLHNPGGTPQMEVSQINTSCRSYSVRKVEPITLADLDRALCWN